MTSYLLAIDESDNSKRAFQFYSRHLSKDYDRLTIVHIEHQVKTSFFDPLGDNLDKFTNIQEKEESKKLKSYFTRECERLNKKIEFEFLIIQSQGGDTAKEIIKLIDKFKAECIIVGSRGLSGLQRVVLGSVSNYLVQNSPIPIVTVP